jgi:diguanylate cyclase (GGDEF)-like protein
MTATSTSTLGHSARVAFLHGVAKRDIPMTLMVTGAIVLAVGVVNFLLTGRFDPTDVLPDAIVAASLIVWTALLRRFDFSAVIVQWSYAAAMVVVVGWLLNEYRTQPDTANMAYVVIVMAVFGPLVLAWIPFATAATVMVASASVVLITSGWGDARGWIAAYIVALLAGAFLLALRIRSLSELALARATAERLATTDPLTGVLNRHGLELLAPILLTSAKRYGQPMVVWFADIDGLKAVNDGHGHALGDRIITVVADAITASTREGDLVARWGGDEFVIVGLGIEPTATPLEQRVDERIRSAGIDPHQWVGTVTFGSASHMPHVASLESLITEADHAMYQARQRI